jgi:hypothetical protein
MINNVFLNGSNILIYVYFTAYSRCTPDVEELASDMWQFDQVSVKRVEIIVLPKNGERGAVQTDKH